MKELQQYLINSGFPVGKAGADGIIGNDTKKALKAYLIMRYKVLGHRLPNNVRNNGITWLRMDSIFTDRFTDFACIWSHGEIVSVVRATTKAGKYYVSNPVTAGGITGTGVQKEGQTLGSHKYHKTGKSKWGSKAGWFEQIKPIQVYRDGNKDNKLDKNIVTAAPTFFGFFFHAMGKGFSVWNWSAGCLGSPLVEWMAYVDPYFEDGDIIDQTIIEING